MRKVYVYFIFFASFIFTQANAQSLKTIFEASNGTESPDYFNIIKWWQLADKASPLLSIKVMGPTDSGYPLHLVTISNKPVKDFATARRNGQSIILINNGIHPGEPDGIDASMLLAKEIITKKFVLPNDMVLAIIPVYNIGGCLNRSEFHRIDQNGPKAFGTRGNAQNLDLNRDFIKCDSRNALSFTEIFHFVNPDIFIDNHVSNGADYQHVMTLLSSQSVKLGGAMGTYMRNKFEPGIYSLMKSKGFDVIPYVNHFGQAVDAGWTEFWDSPRYASGYATLFNVFAFVPETHMLKPYKQRVDATLALMKSFIEFTHQHKTEITAIRSTTIQNIIMQKEFPIKFLHDTTQKKFFEFKGYEAGYKKSDVSGLQRLYYDRSKPYTKTIPLYNYYKPITFITKPKAYIIPQGWWRVIERLKANKVAMQALKKDTTINVQTYYIKSYQSSAKQYETHHANTNIELEKSSEQQFFRKGDWLIYTNQPAIRFLIETLEPNAEDSYFVWNFFDGILNRKEWFSDYAFEDIAAIYLKNNPALKKQLEAKQNTDSAFAKDGNAQLAFIFDNSPFKEETFMRYPVFRIP